MSEKLKKENIRLRELNCNLEDELRNLKHKFVQFDINAKLHKEIVELEKKKISKSSKAGWFVWAMFIFAVVSLVFGLIDRQMGNPFIQMAIIFFAFAMLLGMALIGESNF